MKNIFNYKQKRTDFLCVTFGSTFLGSGCANGKVHYILEYLLGQ